MAGMGMGGMGAMGGMGGPSGAGGVTKKDYKYLTRTDFLLQFVWIPKTGTAPQTPEELKTKLEDEAKKLAEAEKEYADDAGTAKLEETIEAESLKKSKALDSALEKAVGGQNAAGAGGNVPTSVLPGIGVPPAGGVNKAGGPGSK